MGIGDWGFGVWGFGGWGQHTKTKTPNPKKKTQKKNEYFINFKI